jgi:hypothetical protein
MTQQPLTGHGRFYAAVLDADHNVLAAAWQHARTTSGFVGTCGRCGNPLRPLAPYRVGPVAWYPGVCAAEGCDYETSAPGPRPEKKTEKKGAR